MNPYGNNLLRALREEDIGVLKPHFREWQGRRGDVIYEPGANVRFAYFPCGASLAAFIVLLADGKAVETGLVGREGALGGIVSQGRLPAYARATVQFGGTFLRIEAVELEQAKLRSLTLRHFFARYADCLLAQVFQSVACNAVHPIEQRAAKWLVAALDRTGTEEAPLTQEQLAGMLGVGRSYISRVIKSFKAKGVLETRRGRLLVRDHNELRNMACGCQDAVQAHFDIVLKGVYPTHDDVQHELD